MASSILHASPDRNIRQQRAMKPINKLYLVCAGPWEKMLRVVTNEEDE